MNQLAGARGTRRARTACSRRCPQADYERLSASLELVPLPLGRAVYESGGQLDYVYFPTDCIVSLLYVTKDGASAEIAIAGNEGHGRHLAVHGRRDHARAARWCRARLCLPPAGAR